MLHSVKIVHATDIHLLPSVTLSSFLHPKRWIGLFNLYVLGRRGRFSPHAQHALIQHITHSNPQLCIISGDISCLGTEQEFKHAHETLSPLLYDSCFPSLMVAGNHDLYTHSNQHFFQAYFKGWTTPVQHPQQIHVAHRGAQTQAIQSAIYSRQSSVWCDVASSCGLPMMRLPIGSKHINIIGMNPCRPTWIGSTGEYSKQQVRSHTVECVDGMCSVYLMCYVLCCVAS